MRTNEAFSVRKRKFRIGDIVTLEGDIVMDYDPNYGIQGKVIGYSNNPFEECPIVETFSLFKYGEKYIERVEHLSDEWWKLVYEPTEYRCESLL